MSLRKRMLEGLDEDIRQHIEQETQDNIARGMSPEEAHYAALRKFGNVRRTKEETREVWSWVWIEELVQDMRYALRMLRKSPGFTVVAVLTLALGIGANAAMFSITNAVLLRPLPYPEADNLVGISMEDPSRGLFSLNISFTRLALLQEQSRTLQGISACVPSSTSLTTRGTPEQVPAAIVTGNFFDVFGVTPTNGRSFLPQEDQPGGVNVAIISNGFWQSHFGGRMDLIGQSVAMDGRSVIIIGVLPAHFRFPFQEPAPEVWFPRVFENALFSADRVRSGAAYLTVYGRLRPGQSIPQAQAELDSLGSAYSKAFPGNADASGFTVRAASLKEALVGPVRTSLIVLVVGVGFVLLIGCANLANLLLTRVAARQHEITIRRALGASRSRLVRQLLTESLLLSFIGGAAGIYLASNAPRFLRFLPSQSLPRADEVNMDFRVVLFSLGLCALTGIAFGLAPGMRTDSRGLEGVLRAPARALSGGTSAGRFRGAAVVAEVAVALVLVTSSGLLIKSLGRLLRVNPGFDPHDVMTFALSLPQSAYPATSQQAEFYRRLVEAVEALPGVRSAGVTTYLPVSGGTRLAYFCPEGTPCQGLGKDPLAAIRQVSPDYFETMRVPLLRGRVFLPNDKAGSRIVSIINQTLVDHHFAAQDPIGKELILTRGNVHATIVGVVSTVKYAGLNAPSGAEVYLPQEQSFVPESSMSLVVRSKSSPEAVVSTVRAVVAKLDPDLPVSNVLSMEEVISASVSQPQLSARITAAFAGLALLLAAVGIYGVMANSVAQRNRELAIRMALGAPPSEVMRLLVGQGLRLIAMGILFGLAGSLLLTRLFASMLFELSPHDPITFAAVTLMLITVGVVACYVPARRAMRVDPAVALRYE